MITDYWQSTIPGEGRRAPRARMHSDAAVLSLDGLWRFRLSLTASGTGLACLDDDFDDSGWDPMPVPSHWVLEDATPPGADAPRSLRGTVDGPLYTNTAYPIPLDPPYVPSENPTGDYRRVFTVPDGFGPAVLRFEGADSCAAVWLNGAPLGWSTGSRLPFEFDAPVRPGRNVLVVRVHRWSAGTYLEDQDMWWLPGLFRSVSLIARPQGCVDDVFVHADYDPGADMGILRVDATTEGVVSVPELGIDTAVGETVRVPVEPWSADRPRLYRGELRAAGETVELSIGFRRVEVVDGVLHANGRPLFFRGVNRHEHHPRTGRTLDRETMRQDVVMMKRANIDAVRTSHYPPHPDFLDLCDEYGLWVVEENDLETHGFVYTGWEGNPADAAPWRESLCDRLARTVERDKNHPSVVIWSLANESGAGGAFDDMRAWLARRDPDRPVLYERDPTYQNSDFHAVMYPSLEELDAIGRREEPRPDGVGDADDARRRALPFLLIEYAHAMGNGPGSLDDYAHIMRAHPRICGGFVWEWIDHGFDAIDADGIPYVMHGDDVAGYEPRGGRFSLHGLVFSDRTPTPGLAALAKASEPVRIEIDDAAVRIRNDRHAADTADLRFVWRAEAFATTDAAGLPASGSLTVPPVTAGADVTVPWPPTSFDGAVVWTVEAVLADGTPWAPAGHVVAWAQHESGYPAPAVPARLPARAATASGSARPAHTKARGRSAPAGEISVGPGVFDVATGRLRRLGVVAVDGPRLDLYRAPTENDHGQGTLNDIATVWHATGLDRLIDRVDAVDHGDGWLRVHGRTAASAHPHAAVWDMDWAVDDDGLVLTVGVDFTGPWADTPYQHRDIWVPRLGLLFGLSAALGRVDWEGRGPGESYADSFRAARLGRYSAAVDDLQTPYPVPQENGNHVHTRRLRISDGRVAGLEVQGMPHFDFTARRWTSLDLARARHPHDLADSGRVWLNIDHAQQGLGSASVGPALPERYRIPRQHTVWAVRLAPLTSDEGHA